MKITKASIDKVLTIEPYKYYTHPGESIYKIEEGASSQFVHFESGGKWLWGDSWRVSYEKPAENNPELFVKLFKEMVSSGTINTWMYREVEALKKYGSPVIVGGCGRSGTTLLLSILGAHEKIHAIDEELFAFYPNPTRLIRIIRELDGHDMDGKIWCEKTPKNILVFDEIHKIFKGDVKLIHLIRDGRDVTTSVHPYHPGQYWVDIDRWVNDVTKGLEFKDISMIVKYEDLVIKPEETLQRVCSHIGIPYEKELVDYQDSTNVKTNYAWAGEAKKISSNRVGKWKKSEHQDRIDEFTKNERAMALLEELGYLQ